MARKSPKTADTFEVRTTFTPGKVTRVNAAELLDLKRQGLLAQPPKAASDHDGDDGATTENETESEATA